MFILFTFFFAIVIAHSLWVYSVYIQYIAIYTQYTAYYIAHSRCFIINQLSISQSLKTLQCGPTISCSELSLNATLNESAEAYPGTAKATRGVEPGVKGQGCGSCFGTASDPPRGKNMRHL